VNKYNMPLCNINGITNLGTTFNIGFCLLSSEKEEDFVWVLELLTSMMIDHDIPRPFVVMTDIDKALKKAARSVLPDDVKHQVCLWHVLKNVVFNVKKKWNGSLEGTAVGECGGGKGSRVARPDTIEDSGVSTPESGVSASESGATNADSRLAAADEKGGVVARALLHPKDREQYLGIQGLRDPRINEAIDHLRAGISDDPTSGRKFKDTADGILRGFPGIRLLGD
jgi:hypothetical protein